MTRAIRVAPRDWKTAIGEVFLGRIAKRPPALDLADINKSDPPHLADLGRGVSSAVRA